MPAAHAQNEAALSGTVQDTSGAVLPQATVKLTSHEQGTVRNADTNQAGVYQFSFLPPGTYDLDVSAAGFKTLTRTNLTLAAAQNARLDLTLEIGNVSENITVSAAAENVNTESAELGAVVDNTRVVEMPLNGRIFWSLPLLSPGVVPPVQGSSLGYRGGFNVAGSCEGCNNFTLNGIDNNDGSVGSIPNFRPSVDAIQEFNILTGAYPAQYGYASGGQIIITTKSGTNSFHGVAYDFLRNQAVLTARNFFALPGPLASFKRNQFGGTLGGPIRKDKTFFFYSFEGLRLAQAITAAQGPQIATVPLAAMHSGDFSAILGKQVIKDPSTGAPFSGNVIPQARISPEGAALIAFYPSPTSATPAGTLPSNNYYFQATRIENNNSNSLKLDHTFSTKDSGYVQANYFYDTALEPLLNSQCITGPLPGFGCNQNIRSELYGVSEAHIFSPSLVAESRVAFTYLGIPGIGWNNTVNYWGQFGITPRLNSIPGLPQLGVPGTTVTGYQSFPQNYSYYRHDPHYVFTEAVSWTKGRHTIKIGSGLSHFTDNNANTGNATGTVAFTNSSTGPTSGYALADMLLGLPASTTNQPYVYVPYLYNATVYAYAQDDYKVSSSLTLNIGLRWEINTTPGDHSNRLTNFNPATATPVTQANPAPGATGGPLRPGFSGNHVLNFDWHDFAPRFGFAWQPFRDGKTVIRGGGGTYYNTYALHNAFGGIYDGFPYTINNSYTASVAQPLLLSNPFPSTNAVVSSNQGGADPNFRNARVYEWSLGIQRQLTNDMVAEAIYMGSAGNHLQITQNINQPAPGPGTPAQVNARRPYAQYGTINYYEFDGNSRFNSLQASLKKRYGYGLSFLAAWTFSKSVDDLGPYTNNFNFTTGRGLSTFDVRNRIVFSPVYELPFGKGKPFLGQGMWAPILGGWQLSSLVQWQTGNPLTATLSGNFSNTGGTTDRPNLTGDPNANAPHTPQQWFNTAVFQIPIASGQPGAPYSFGNEGRDVIESPGLVNVDLSIVRTFQAREWLKVEFRIEFFDAFNHPNFNFPGLVANTTSFGLISGALDPRLSQFAMKLIF